MFPAVSCVLLNRGMDYDRCYLATWCRLNRLCDDLGTTALVLRDKFIEHVRGCSIINPTPCSDF